MVHRGELKFRSEPVPEQPQAADFIICHDDKTCEIKKGKEKEVAEGYALIARELTPEQKEIVIETLLANELLTDEQALEFSHQLPWDSRTNIIKFVGKTIRPDRYNDLVVQTLAELRSEEKLSLDPNLTTNDDNFQHFHEISNTLIRLTEFFTTEAADRYADFALFDEIGAPTYRKNLISTETSAKVLAKNLAKWGHLTSPEQGKVLFKNLLESFPAVLAPVLEKVTKYDAEGRDPTMLVGQLFFNLWTVARTEAHKKIPQPLRLPDYNKKTAEEEKIALTWRDYEEKVDAEANELSKDSTKKFLDSLSSLQKQILLKNWAELNYNSLMTPETEALVFINNWDNFSEINLKIKETFIQALPKTIFNPSDKLFEALEQHGLLKKVVQEAARNSPSFLGRAIEQGFIIRAGLKLTKEVFAELDSPDHYNILLKNPKLLQEFSCRPPRERLEALTEHEVNYMFFIDLEGLWEYAERAKKIKLHDKYTLDEEEVVRAAVQAIKENPEASLNTPKIIKIILGEKFLQELFQNYILHLDLHAPDLQNLNDIFIWADEHYAKIIKDSPGVRARLQELLNQNPEVIAEIGWRNLGTIFTTPTERNKFILDHLDQLLSLKDGRFLVNMVEELGSSPKTLAALIHKVEEQYPTYLPKLLFSLAEPARARQISVEVNQEELKRLALLVKGQIRQNHDLALINLADVKRLSRGGLFTDLGLTQIIETSLEKWCRTRPEDVWANRTALVNLLGFNVFWEYILENKDQLADIISEDAYWLEQSRANRNEGEERLKLLLKELIQDEPTKLYYEDGTLANLAYVLKIHNAREILWNHVNTLPFFNFFSKRLRNLLTASEELDNQGLDPEFIAIVQRCERLSKSPMKDILLRLIAILPRRRAQEFLDRADALIAVCGDQEFAKDFANEQDLDKIQAGLEKQIGESLTRMFDIDSPVTNKELIANPRSLLYYAKAHENDEKIILLLRTMVTAELGGQFKNWKFFEGEANHQQILARLKSKNLLPKNLSLEQYEKWVADDHESAQLDLHVDISEVLQANTAIARDALRLGHLKTADDESIFTLEKNVSVLAEIETRLRTMSDDERGEYLKEMSGELQERRAHAYLSKILSISSQEALTKQLKIERVGTVPLDRAFRILNQVFADQAEFINDLGKIQANIEALGRKYETIKQKLTATDETNFISSLEIGSKPVSTCQNIRGSKSFNRALLAYGADPNTKIFVVRGEGGQLIARSIARLLEDQAGQPVLFLETIYKANPSTKIDELVINFAKSKAQSLGIPLVARTEGRKARGGQTVKLQNFGSRSEYLYTDEGGGLIKGGKFTIMRARLI